MGLVKCFARFAAVFALTVIGGSCVQRDQEVGHSSHVLIEEESAEVVTAADLRVGEAEVSWPLGTRQELSGWDLKDLEVVDEVAAWTTLRSSSVDSRMVRAASLDADRLFAIEMDISGQVGSGVRLFWAPKGEPFTGERSVVAEQNEAEGVALFPVGEHPLWSGHIARVRIDPTNIENGEVSVGTVRLLRHRTPTDEPQIASVIKLDLAGDVRNAVVLVPGADYRHPMTVAPGCRLRFSVACLRAPSGSVGYAVVLEDGKDGGVVLHEESVDIDEGGSPLEWSEREIRIEGVREGSYTIAFEIRGGTGEDGGEASLAVANPEVLQPREGKPPPNVLLVSIDTLRAVNMSLYGYGRDTTPNFEHWASTDAVVFENVIAPSPWTKPSHVSIFTGRDALDHAVNFNEMVPPEYELISETFRAAGYTTFAVTGGGYLRPEWGFAQGFDVFRYWEKEGDDGELTWGLDELRRRLEDAAGPRRPFFAFFHTYEVHAPYRRRSPFFDQFVLQAGGREKDWFGEFTTHQEPPDGGRPEFRLRRYLVERPGPGGAALPILREDLPDAVAAYDSGIAFVDQEIGKLFEFLRRVDLYDNTIIIVTSDHGEAFGEHGNFGHSSLYDTLLRVPLIVMAPGLSSAGARVGSQVRLIDIAPTILELAGLPVPQSTDGRSLVDLLRSPQKEDHREAWSYAGSTNYGVALRIENRLKAVFPFTVWRYAAGFEPEVYDLTTDAGEHTNLAKAGPEAKALLERIRERLGERGAGVRVSLRNPLTEAYRVTLKGKDVGFFRAKSANLPSNCVEWVPGIGLVIEVRPGADFDLVLDGYTGGEVRCEVAAPAGRAGPEVFTWTQERLLSGFEVQWSESSWELPRDGEEPAASVKASLATVSPEHIAPSVNDAHRRQLEALGYVE